MDELSAKAVLPVLEVVIKSFAEFVVTRRMEAVVSRTGDSWHRKLASEAAIQIGFSACKNAVERWLSQDRTRDLLAQPEANDNHEMLRQGLTQELVDDWMKRVSTLPEDGLIESKADSVLTNVIDNFLEALGPAKAIAIVDERAETRHKEIRQAIGRLSVRSQLLLEDPAWLEEARARLAELPLEAVVGPGPLPTGSRMDIPANPLFVGRIDDLMRMATLLKGGETVALGQVVAATGLGGLGKTQLAAEFTHRYGRYFAGGVFWLSFASAEEIPLQVASCGGPGHMGLGEGWENRSLEERLELVLATWRSELPRLLIFDNCEDETLLTRWRPPTGGCRVLVTARREAWTPSLGVSRLQVDVLDRTESLELLVKFRSDLGGGEDTTLATIAQELGDLPLALHLAGSYLQRYQVEVSPDKYLAHLRESELIEHASLVGRSLSDKVSPTHHVQSVAQTFQLSYQRLDVGVEADRIALAVLARGSHLAPGELVPRELLQMTLKRVVGQQGELVVADALGRLGELGLIERLDEGLRMHRLVSSFVRAVSADNEAVVAVDEALIECGRLADDGWLVGSRLVAVMPHLQHLTRLALDGAEDVRTARLCNALGTAFQASVDYAAAGDYYRRALAIRERALGPDHPDTASSLSELTWLLKAQGERAAARPLAERALEIRERVLGPDHPDTAISLNSLAVLLKVQGELTTARPLYERALDIKERVLGPDHPGTATSLNNLALLLKAQRELAAARPLSERALAIRERVLGPNHPSTATSLNNLALLLKAQGDLAAARPLLERALEIRERVFGPDHRVTDTSRRNLATLSDQS